MRYKSPHIRNADEAFSPQWDDEVQMLRGIIAAALEECDSACEALERIAGPTSIVIGSCEKLQKLQKETKQLMNSSDVMIYSAVLANLFHRLLDKIEDSKLRYSIIDEMSVEMDELNTKPMQQVLEENKDAIANNRQK
jgi:precorrin-6B methylase 2